MLTSEPAHAQQLVDDDYSKTLEELDRQQSERLKSLIVDLLARQKQILGNIASQEMQTEFSASLHAKTGLHNLLINEKLINPSDAVAKRKQLIEEYLSSRSNNCRVNVENGIE